MNPKEKTNELLLNDVEKLRKYEVANAADILVHLQEVYNRKLYLQLGFDSLYRFCRERLGYRKDEAYYRKCAVHCLNLGPEIEANLRANKLSLSTLQLGHVTFEGENARRQKLGKENVTNSEKLAAFHEIAHSSVRSARKILAKRFPQAEKNNESTKPITDQLTLITFAANDEEMEDFEWLKDQYAHGNYERKWRKLFAKLARDTRARLEKEQNRARPKGKPTKAATDEKKSAAARRTPPVYVPDAVAEAADGMTRVSTAHSGEMRVPPAESETLFQELTDAPDFVTSRNSRLRSVHVERALIERAGSRCEYVDSESGKRCDSSHALQIDEVQPIAFGGTNDFSNLRILCANHNQFVAWKVGLARKKNVDHESRSRPP